MDLPRSPFAAAVTSPALITRVCTWTIVLKVVNHNETIQLYYKDRPEVCFKVRVVKLDEFTKVN